MLCYMPQVWASDNTDALCRDTIQHGYSYGYPQSVLGCHVSAVPNHQTLRTTPLRSRFRMSCLGLLGYELNLCELSREEKEEIRAQVAFYKEHRRLLQFGRFYRVKKTENESFRMVVSPEGEEAIGVHFVQRNLPNQGMAPLRAAGLVPELRYTVTAQPDIAELEDFGGLVNHVSPVHLRPGSLVHTLAGKVVKLPEAVPELTATGQMFMSAGFHPTQCFSGSGFGQGIRVMKDCDSRLYLWKKEE